MCAYLQKYQGFREVLDLFYLGESGEEGNIAGVCKGNIGPSRARLVHCRTGRKGWDVT